MVGDEKRREDYDYISSLYYVYIFTRRRKHGLELYSGVSAFV